jgi:hypothetical protein
MFVTVGGNDSAISMGGQLRNITHDQSREARRELCRSFRDTRR